MEAAIGYINGFIWGYVLIYLLLGVGILFTLRLGFLQLRHFTHMFTVMRHSRKSDKNGISSFQALCTTLASRVGTGNLAGVAIALSLGGPGAIFWMWLTAILGMATSFAESALAQLFKVKDKNDTFRGGPAFYMQYGLGKRWMGVVFAIFLLFTYGFAFNAVQTNSIGAALNVAFHVPHWLTGVIVTFLTAIIIFGGLRKVAHVAEYIVPVMAAIYLIVAVGVIVMNLSALPGILALIVKSAFGWHQAGGGAVGYMVSIAMMNGIKRGLFSNEAGMGSAPNAAASATLYPAHPASQGYVQMLGPFIDTIVICTATAAIILLSGQLHPGSGMTGIELTQKALSSQVGSWGEGFVAVAIFLFAFTSVLGNYSYTESNLMYINCFSKTRLTIFRLAVLGFTYFGAVGTLPVVWAMADLSMGLMAITNLIAMVMLSGMVVVLVKDYHGQMGGATLPRFNVNNYPNIKAKIAPGMWDGKRADVGDNVSQLDAVAKDWTPKSADV